MLSFKVEVPRDRYGRPLIAGTAHTRASTLAKTLDDTRALLDWNARQSVIGLCRSHDLIALAATTDPGDKVTLNRIVEQAKERAATTAAASIGTATHTATEILDRGESLDGLPETVKADAQAYRAKLRGYSLLPLAAEMFVVCEELVVAGSFDRLLAGPSRTLIGDIKTSGNPDTHKYAGLAWAIQLAVYAHAKPWTPERGIVEWSDLGLPVPDQHRGVVIHIVQGTARVRLHSVDLDAGWLAAKLAAEVRDMRKFPVTELIP